jgi:hypothetical protein
VFVTSNAEGGQAGLAANGRQDPDWHSLLAAAATTARPPVVAQRHVRAIGSGSKPHLFKCDDGQHYAVKFRGNPHGDGRGIFTEQVVARLGQLIGAPVPEVRLVNVTAELLAPLNLDIGGGVAESGLHHGSCWAEGFSDRMNLDRYPDRNREKYAALRLLYSWLVCTGDHQVIYRDAEPHDVLSVDHGMFLPGSTGWTALSLRSFTDDVQPDQAFVALNLTEDEHAPTLDKLGTVSPEAIADVAAAPPAEWGISRDDREAFAGFVERRRVKLLASFGRSGG